MLILNRLNKATYKKALEFYSDIITQSGATPKKPRVLLVCPGYESTFPMIESIASHFDLCGIIIKNSTEKANISLKRLLREEGYPVLDISKSEIQNASNKTIQIIREAIGKKSCVLLDHGGYFALNAQLLKIFDRHTISGVAEYALNGEHRYASLAIDDRPVISIGRLKLKRKSDFASADSILLAAEMYLQNGGVMLFKENIRVGIIGHGTLGGRIRYGLQTKNAKNFLIHDTDTNQLTELPEKNIAKNIEEIYKTCNIIFCATGNHAIKPIEFKSIEDGTIIFTVTSPDDELNLEHLINEGVISLQENSRHSQTYIYTVRSTGHKIILPFNGESANTLIDFGIADPSIHQPCAAHIIAGKRLAQKNTHYSCGVQSLNTADETLTFNVWQHHYNSPLSAAR